MDIIANSQEQRHTYTTSIYYQERNLQLKDCADKGLEIKAIINKNKHRKLFIKTPKILLVEDTPIIQAVNMNFLTMFGCEVDLAKDGFEAIDMFKNNYDLILLDIGLPDKNGISKTGIDVVKEIRSFEKKTGIKHNIIIALTAFGDTMQDQCMTAGCDDFYVKPLALDPLGKMLQRWLPKHINQENQARCPINNGNN